MPPRSSSASGGPAPIPVESSKGLADLITWTDELGHRSTVVADTRVRTLSLERSLPARRSGKYPGRRNYEVLYWFTSSGRRVWFESLFERTALMVMDHQQEVATIAAQPFKLTLEADGVRCTRWPDYFMVHGNGDQVVLDVHPSEMMSPETVETYRRTAQFCDRVGWRYELFTDIDRVFQNNLEWLAGYRHSRNRPSTDVADRICRIFRRPRTLEDGCQLFDPAMPTTARSLIYNLLWQRRLTTDLSHPLTSANLLKEAA
jgi:hypothetical protein